MAKDKTALPVRVVTSHQAKLEERVFQIYAGLVVANQGGPDRETLEGCWTIALDAVEIFQGEMRKFKTRNGKSDGNEETQ